MPIKINCQNCGKEFNVKPSRLDEKKFCSRECKHKNGRIDLTCLNCKKTFTKIAFRSDAIFCGRDCKTAYSCNKFICDKCGKEFTRGKAYQGAAKYCSVECRRIEGCQGIKNCERCGKEFSWNRDIKRGEPKFCSLICRGHTGFRPGGEFRINELTEKEKLEKIKLSYEKHVIRNENGCWDWKGPKTPFGYGVMSCSKEYGIDRAHRASWIIHHGPIPEGMHVCHSCDFPPCSRPDHLWLGTHKQNNDDKIAKGRQAYNKPPIKKGSDNASAKLTEEQVREIKILIAKGHSCYGIAKDYGVSKQTILRIKNGVNWSHIKD